MGREMVRLVLQQIDQPGSAPSQVVFATELILRGSTGDAGEGEAEGHEDGAPSARWVPRA
jgi:hypothetical protein